MKNYNEKALFFPNNENNYKLYGVDYCPNKPNGLSFVFLQPLGIERNVVDAVQVNLARELATAGIRVLRFDYYGTGDSEGEFSKITLQSLLSDIKTAVNHLTDSDSIDIGIFGLRFGALLASIYAESEICKYLIMAAPVTNAYDSIMKELRQTLSMQTVLFKKVVMDRKQIIQNILNQKKTTVDGYDLANINGFTLTREFLTSMENVEILENKKNFSNNCLVINIDKNKRSQPKVIEKLISTYGSSMSISYNEIIEKQLLWVHGNHLIKISRQLNSCVLTWIESLHGNNS